jgi:hypothetical protein
MNNPPFFGKMADYFSCRFEKYAAPHQFTFSVDIHVHPNIGSLLFAFRMKTLESRKR